MRFSVACFGYKFLFFSSLSAKLSHVAIIEDMCLKVIFFLLFISKKAFQNFKNPAFKICTQNFKKIARTFFLSLPAAAIEFSTEREKKLRLFSSEFDIFFSTLHYGFAIGNRQFSPNCLRLNTCFHQLILR